MASMSVKTIGSPEFLNITSINPLISKCEIKVLYIGENRNRSFISKEVAREMAATLPGTPIVGHYIESKEDFGDHGQQIIIDDEGIKFKTLTTPYGFVAPESKIWFQKFEETDEYGKVVSREYLMTEGYLWTGQFEECKRVVDGGNPQSMELDENSLKGHWSEDYNRGIEFFIINDAIFSKLCILGEDVEPCFEGACVTAPGATFSKNEGFNKTLYNMMQELKDALKGEEKMENEQIVVTEEVSTEFEISQDKVDETIIQKNEKDIEATVIEEVEAPNVVVEAEEIATEAEAEVVEPVAEIIESEEAPAVEESSEEVAEADVEETAEADTDFSKTEENVVDIISEDNTEEYACKKDKEDYECKKKTQCAKEEDSEEEKKPEEDSETAPAEKKEEEDDEEKKKYALLEEKYAELESKYSSLEAEYQKLSAFKKEADDKAKDELISSFSMLTEAEMKDVIDNKTKYSIEDIESKLSVIFARKQRAEKVEAKATEEQAPVIYSVDNDYSNLSEWMTEVLKVQKTM